MTRKATTTSRGKECACVGALERKQAQGESRRAPFCIPSRTLPELMSPSPRPNLDGPRRPCESRWRDFVAGGLPSWMPPKAGTRQRAC